MHVVAFFADVALQSYFLELLGWLAFLEKPLDYDVSGVTFYFYFVSLSAIILYKIE